MHSKKPSRHSSAQRRAEQHQLAEPALHNPENCESREIIGKTLIPADSFGTRTLRTPPEGDYDDHFAGRSRPNHRSVRLGHNV
jgi:hypothetical protein